MYYSSIGMLAIVLLVIINADTLFRRHGSEGHAHSPAYRAFLFASLLYYTADSFWGILMDIRIVPVVYADTILYFISMGLCVLTWVRYIAIFLNQNQFWTRVLNTVGLVILGSEVLIIIVNFFYPVMFSFTGDGDYIARPARYVILYVQLVLFAIIAVDTLLTASKLKDNDRYPPLAIGISGLIMSLFILLQAHYPLMPFYAIGNLIATCIVNSFVVVGERIESSRRIGSIMTVAYKDSLTNVRNNTAYTEFKETISDKIRRGLLNEFAVIVFDLNDLKKVNDTDGHDAGDRYIREGCELICRTFDHSPVFRIGGDEFVACLMNEDFRNRDSLYRSFNEQIENNIRNGGVVVSAGISVYYPGKDSGYDDVFVRADELMYDRKKELKKKRLRPL